MFDVVYSDDNLFRGEFPLSLDLDLERCDKDLNVSIHSRDKITLEYSMKEDNKGRLKDSYIIYKYKYIR